jgi:hypothetical protein
MKKINTYIILIFIFLTQTSLSQANCDKIELYKTSIINNVLNLSEEQIELQKYSKKEFKKHLTKEQKNKYKIISKLIEKDRKKHKKNYYKSNPKLQYFGNPLPCQITNKNQK